MMNILRTSRTTSNDFDTSLLTSLPEHHKDQFDRLLISQALVQDLSIVSIDQAFDAYGIKRIW